MSSVRLSFAWLTVTVSVGVTAFFTLYSLIPVTRPGTPELSSLFLGVMMAFVMGVQVFAPMLVAKFSLRTVLIASILSLGSGALIVGVFDALVALLCGAVLAGAGFGVLIVVGTQGVALLVPAHQLGRAIGLFGMVTMLATATGSPAGVQLAVSVSPQFYGVVAFAASVLGAMAAIGVPRGVGRVDRAATPDTEADMTSGAVGTATGTAPNITPNHRLGALIREVPWHIIAFLLLTVLLFSHGLTSAPSLAMAVGNAAAVIFAMQCGNAFGRWAGGELEARTSRSLTLLVGAGFVAAGAAVGVWLPDFVAILVSAAVLGVGIGVVQTLTLHLTMQLLSAGRASVVWNLTIDFGLWIGGIIWGLALAGGWVPPLVLAIAAATMVAAILLAPALRSSRLSPRLRPDA